MSFFATDLLCFGLLAGGGGGVRFGGNTCSLSELLSSDEELLSDELGCVAESARFNELSWAFA